MKSILIAIIIGVVFLIGCSHISYEENQTNSTIYQNLSQMIQEIKKEDEKNLKTCNQVSLDIQVTCQNNQITLTNQGTTPLEKIRYILITNKGQTSGIFEEEISPGEFIIIPTNEEVMQIQINPYVNNQICENIQVTQSISC